MQAPDSIARGAPGRSQVVEFREQGKVYQRGQSLIESTMCTIVPHWCAPLHQVTTPYPFARSICTAGPTRECQRSSRAYRALSVTLCTARAHSTVLTHQQLGVVTCKMAPALANATV